MSSMPVKIFKNGASQAVRLPKEFRLSGNDFRVRKVGDALLIFSAASAWDLMESTFGKASDDFLPDRGQPKKPQRRKKL